MGTVDLVVLVESPGSVARGMQRVGRAGHQVGEPSTGKIFPKYRGDLLEAAIVVQRMREGLVEEMRYPRNPLDVLAQQIVAACAIDEWNVDELLRARAPVRELRRAVRGRVPRDARHARGALSLRSFQRPAAARRVGPRRGPRPRPRRRAAGRGAERRHDPRPRPVRRVPARRRPRRRARRGDGLREPRRRVLRARRVDLADRGDHRRPRRRHARAGRARQDAVLEGRPPGPAARARPRARRARARAARASTARGAEARAAATAASTRAPRRTCACISTSRPRRPARSPTTARSSSSASPTRSATGACASSRRSARACTRRGRSRSRNGSRAPTCPVQVLWSDDGIILRLPESIDDVATELLLPDPDEIDELLVAGPAEHVAVRVEVPRERGARVAAPPPPARRAHAAVAAAPARRRPARGRERLPDVPDAVGDDPRMPARRVRRSRAARGAHRDPLPQAARRAGRDPARVAVRAVAAVRLDRGVHVRGRRAARRTPRRPRSRSTATCCATSWAPRSCASCSIPRCSPSSSSSCSAWSRPVRPATPTTCTTCSPTSGRSRSTRSRARCAADPQPWLDALRAERRVIEIGGRLAAAEDAAPAARRARLGDPAGPARRVHRSRRTPARRRRRPLRAHARAVHDRRAHARASTSPSSGRATRSTRLEADGRVVFGEFRPGRRRTRMVRHQRAAHPAPPLARRAAARDRTGRRDHLRPLPRRVAGRRAAGRRGTDALVEALEQLQGVAIPASVLERDVLPGARRRLPAGHARRAVRGGRAGVDRRGRARRRRRPGAALLPRPRAPAGDRGPRSRARPTARSTTRSATGCCARARASGPTSSPRPAPPTTRVVLTALWDLVWAGEVTNDTFGPLRVPRRAARTPLAEPRPGRIRAGSPASVRPRARGVGRSSCRCSNPSRRRPNARTRPRCSCSNARASSRAKPCAPRARPAASRACTRCCARSRSRAGPGAGGSSPGSAPRSSRCRARSTGCARTAPIDEESRARVLVLAATDPAQPYGAALVVARTRRRIGAAVALGGRVRRARRRRVRRVPRAGRQGARHLRVRRRRPRRARGPKRSSRRTSRAASPRVQIERIDDEPARTSPHAAALRAAGFADGYKGLTLR